MLKSTVNRILALTIVVAMLVSLVALYAVIEEDSETTVFAIYSYDDDEAIYPSETITEEQSPPLSEPVDIEISEEEAPIEIVPASIPVTTYDELTAAIVAANDGDTIELGANISGPQITLSTSLTLTSEIGASEDFIFTATSGRHFVVGAGVTLRLENVILSGGDPSDTAIRGGVQVNNGGHLYLYEGSVIENNRAAAGGGVNVAGGGTLTMGTPEREGGMISGNTTSGSGLGGGVNVAANGTFTMHSGTIHRNDGHNGGGVAVSGVSGVVFTMNGGQITHNEARNRAGGVEISGAHVTLNGGSISHNTAVTTGGGIHLATNVLNRLWIYSNAVISDNNAGTHGGGINSSGGTTYLRGGTISNNWTSGNGNGGGVNLLPAGGSVPIFIMEEGMISGNWTSGTGNGGGVNLSLQSTIFPQFTMNDGTIYDNEAQQGGGVSVSTGVSTQFSMNDGLISDNTARNQGGGVNVNQGIFEMFDGFISDNTAGAQGGGIRMDSNGIVEIHEAEIRNNTGTVGGGIHIGQTNTERGRLHIYEDVLITENTATSGTGGGINFSGGSLQLHGSLTTNVSSGDGGGIEIGSSIASIQDVVIDGALFSGNRSGGAGGGINTQNVAVGANVGRIFTIQNIELYNNHADNRGGGMRLGLTSNLTLGQGNNIIIHNNTTYGNGGGIFVASSFNQTLNIHDGVRIFNNISNHGGGIYHHGGTIHMHGSEIHNNTAIVNGGGVTLNNASVSAGSFTMHTGMINNNNARNDGGGIFARLNHSTFNMVEGTIEGNTASNNGGGIHAGSAFVNLNGGSISHNTAGNNGGGMWLAFNNSAVYVNDGEFTHNHAGSDGGAIFVTHTRTDNPLVDPVNVYPRLRLITDRVDFASNTAGGGEFAPPDNWHEIARFNGLLLTNHHINYRSNWRVVFLFHGGNVNGNEGPIDYIFNTSGSVAERTITPERVPGPPDLVRPKHIFVGWRNRDYEPIWDEDWDGIFDIWSPEDVATYVVNGSTVFEAVWRLRYPPTVPFDFHKTGEELYNVAEWNTPGWVEGILRSGAHFSLFRYTGHDTPATGLVTEAMITDGIWEYVDSAISSGILDDPISFQLIPDMHYQLIETASPAGYTLPTGQWRIVAIDHENGEEVGFRITSQGDSALAFANIGGEFENGAYFGGMFFVGNRLEFTLPIFGGTGISSVTILIGLLLLTTTLVFSMRYLWKRKKE
ncbi:MAG: hypothetical protein FWE07_06625 [Turicibacter sp.]|nr:hypothetical protein [Turicibacter sp.]